MLSVKSIKIIELKSKILSRLHKTTIEKYNLLYFDDGCLVVYVLRYMMCNHRINHQLQLFEIIQIEHVFFHFSFFYERTIIIFFL